MIATTHMAKGRTSQLARACAAALICGVIVVGARADVPKLKLPVPIEAPLPDYPEALRKAGIEGTIVCQLIVTAKGTVAGAIAIESPDERLNAHTLASLRRWKFEQTAMDGGAFTTVCNVPIKIQGAGIAIGAIMQPQEPDRLPQVTVTVAPAYPFPMYRAGIEGGVILHFFVDTNGRVVDAAASKSTNEEFAKESIEALLKWRFTPGTVDGQPVPVAVSQEISFVEGNTIILEPNGLWFDKPPEAREVVPAVYPHERFMAGENGSAVIKIAVDPEGRVEQTRIIRSSEPEFGLSMAAAVESWRFEPAQKDTKPTHGVIEKGFVFSLEVPDSPIDEATSELAQRIHDGKFSTAKSGDLDAKLKPKLTRAPIYPTALMAKKRAGSAKIEVIIDKKGRAVLPRIIEASEPEFGWAAATAVQRWLFDPPTVGGKPVEVKVVIPVRFTPPKPRERHQS